MAAPKPQDMRAGFIGLVVGAVFLLVFLTTVVHFTHRHYANEKPAAAEGQ